jgi:enolase
MPTIEKLSALEILDSRGRPTVQATCVLRSGVASSASVPSGASTGRAEAWELRDGDRSRYGGLGCRRAVANIAGEIGHALTGRHAAGQADLDQFLCELDGTTNKARLGANALLAVSLAFARAAAQEQQLPLFVYFGGLVGTTPRLPQLTVNLFSGGKHAGGQIPIQDVLLVPRSARSVDAALAMVYAVYQAAAALCLDKYAMRALSADEGGLAPPFLDADAMLYDAVQAIARAGLRPGEDVALAVDVAASHFCVDGSYHLDHQHLASQGMIAHILAWLDRYPIISVEDGLAEEDWAAWPELNTVLQGRALTLGDDFLCTHPARIGRAIEMHAANALLLKVNQVGTLTEAAAAYRLARRAGWAVVVSARSGETEDNWLADLATGWAADFIKVGSITQSERLAKYNRLLEIEARYSLSYSVSEHW